MIIVNIKYVIRYVSINFFILVLPNLIGSVRLPYPKYTIRL